MLPTILNVVVLAAMFCGFIAFTVYYIWPPLVRAIEERAMKMAQGFAAANRSEQLVRDARSGSEDIVEVAKVRALEIQARADRQAAAIVEAAKARAQREAETATAAAAEAIANKIEVARAALQTEIAVLAQAAAEKILGRPVDMTKHADIAGDLGASMRRASSGH
jgi:F-type H+-transporting ATPase subunit b